jgi:4-oxalocrotonate tautomerase
VIRFAALSERILRGGIDAMPFVNIRLYEGHGKERKDEIARRITDTISDVCQVPKQAVWVVFEDVPPADWYAAGSPGQPVKK